MNTFPDSESELEDIREQARLERLQAPVAPKFSVRAPKPKHPKPHANRRKNKKAN